jgi:hypothetical protein
MNRDRKRPDSRPPRRRPLVHVKPQMWFNTHGRWWRGASGHGSSTLHYNSFKTGTSPPRLPPGHAESAVLAPRAWQCFP